MDFVLPDNFFAFIGQPDSVAALQRSPFPGQAGEAASVEGFPQLLSLFAAAQTGQSLPVQRQNLPVPQVPLPAIALVSPDALSGQSVPASSPNPIFPDQPQPIPILNPRRGALPPNLEQGRAPRLPQPTASADPVFDRGNIQTPPTTIKLDRPAPQLPTPETIPVTSAPAAQLAQQLKRGPSITDKPATPVIEEQPDLLQEPELEATQLVKPKNPRVESAALERIDVRVIDPARPAPQPTASAPSQAPIETGAKSLPTGPPVVAELSPMDRDFSQRLTEQVRVLVNQNGGEARIRMNPPELGALDIRVNMADDKTMVTFSATHSSTREVLEQNMSRLRALFDTVGLELGDTEVSSNRHDQRPAQAFNVPAHSTLLMDEVRDSDRSTGPSVHQQLVDLYA